MRKSIDENVIVPIPENGHVCSDRRVYVVLEARYYPDLKYNMDKRIWIGKAISDTEMHPNDTYKIHYADEIAKVTHLNLPIYHKKVGLYAAALSIAVRIGLYEDLVEYLGPESANLAMDYAVYSIATRSNAAKNFAEEMTYRMQFLKQPYSDSWIHDKIQKEITDDQVQAFKSAWLRRFDEEKLNNVWVCVDGSNDDCRTDIDEAEKGKAKSHNNVDIISFMYAVTEDGTPIASQIYRGSRVDSKALIAMVQQLSDYNVRPKGVDLDRGFCDGNSIRLLKERGYDYVIKLKENTAGFQSLLKKYGEALKFNWDYALGGGMYGTGETVTVFGSDSLQERCIIIWDAKNGGMRIDYLVDGVLETIRNAEEAMRDGLMPDIPSKYAQYIKVLEVNGVKSLQVEKQLLQKDMNEKGYSGLICSMDLSAEEAQHIYGLRDSSEKQYSILKTQLGGSAMRAHTMHGITVREMFAFVASIIRNEILKECLSHRPRYDTNKVIKELDMITMDMGPDGDYQVLNHQSKKQNEILSMFGVTKADLDHIAAYDSKRIHDGMVSPIHTLSGGKEEQGKTVRINGKPAGSKANGKYARTQKKKPSGSKSDGAQKDQSEQEQPKRGRGRPKGSKNKAKKTNPQ